MRKYSEFFQTLHDEQCPTGNLGRGTHYSVLRAVLTNLDHALFYDFAIIWDEDHDLRVIEAIEMMYFKNLLPGALMIGERKGGLHVITDPLYKFREDENYAKEIENVAQGLDDPWSSSVESIDQCSAYIIHDKVEKINLYLKNIDMLHQLGTKPIPRLTSF